MICLSYSLSMNLHDLHVPFHSEISPKGCHIARFCGLTNLSLFLRPLRPCRRHTCKLHESSGRSHAYKPLFQDVLHLFSANMCDVVSYRGGLAHNKVVGLEGYEGGGWNLWLWGCGGGLGGEGR